MYLHFQWQPSYFEPYFRYGARSDSVILDKGSFALMLSQKIYVFTESQYYLKEILNIMIRVLLASFYFFSIFFSWTAKEEERSLLCTIFWFWVGQEIFLSINSIIWE